MKRFWMGMACVVLLVAGAACTREKPAAPTPTLVSEPVLPSAVTPKSLPSVPAGSTATAPQPGATIVVPNVGNAGQGALPTPTLPSNFSATAGPPPPGAGATPLPGGGGNPLPTDIPAEAGNTGGSNPPASGGGGGCSNPYIVQRGEWLYSIARKCGTTPQAIQAANPGANLATVFPGQSIVMPGGGASSGGGSVGGGRTYVVRPGDTLFSIAARFGTTPAAIQAANHLASVNSIYAGQTLIIP